MVTVHMLSRERVDALKSTLEEKFSRESPWKEVFCGLRVLRMDEGFGPPYFSIGTNKKVPDGTFPQTYENITILVYVDPKAELFVK